MIYCVKKTPHNERHSGMKNKECELIERKGQGQVAGTCESGNESSASVKCGEFLDQLETGQLLKKDSAPWSK